MSGTIIATIAYGLLACFGGIFGYVKAKSKPSLISGCISGGLLLTSAFMQFQGMMLGLIIARVITILLVCVFTARLIKTKKALPAGLMLTTGIITLIVLLTQ
ncbi:MAG: TMEM14 family protein [Xenococcaceae cyanobacterium MO_188.B19]|nr:TMEM14 family protein [Xenococcaceae cyanobacterium MO_188.B19]